MGQYFKAVNLDKKEYIHGHQIDNGLKLVEQIGFIKSTSTALWLLVADNGCRWAKHEFVSRWKGDRIQVVGDYGDEELYSRIEDEFTNISKEVGAMLSELNEVLG